MQRALVLLLLSLFAVPAVAQQNSEIVYLDEYVETGLPSGAESWTAEHIAAYEHHRDFLKDAIQEGEQDPEEEYVTPEYFVYVGVQIPICKLKTSSLTSSSDSSMTISSLPLPGAEDCCWVMVEVCSPENFINVQSILVTPYGQSSRTHNPISNIGGGCTAVAIVGRCNSRMVVDFYGADSTVDRVSVRLTCKADECNWQPQGGN